MIKVLRVINRFNLGGPTYNAAYLTKYLPEEFETKLVGGIIDKSEGESTYILKNLGIEPIIIPEMKRSISLSDDRKAYNKLKQIIAEYKPDVVHTHASKPGALGRRAAAEMGVPVIVHTFHGHVFDKYFNRMLTRFYINVEKRLAKQSTCLIALSDKQKYDLVDKYQICADEKVRIVPLGFDLARFQTDYDKKRLDFRNKYKIEEDEVAIGIIGRLVPIKNHELFMKSLKFVLDNTKTKVRAFIIGDGEEKHKLEKMARSLEISFTSVSEEIEKKDLIFTSWIKEIDWAMAGLDIVSLTSHNEGTPVSLIEAQASNTPVITTNVGGISDIVIDDLTAKIVDSFDPDEFGKALLEVVDDKEKRDAMAVAGWNFVKEKFSYNRLVTDMAHLYKELLDKAK